MKTKQLELFPTGSSDNQLMSYDWWLDEVATLLDGYIGVPLSLLIDPDCKDRAYIYIETFFENLEAVFKEGTSVREALSIILNAIIVYEFDTERHLQYHRIKNSREAYPIDKNEYLPRGLTSQNKLLIDKEFNTEHYTNEKKVTNLEKVIGLKPYCTINPEALLVKESAIV